ncbi:MAG TPA: hypothetical protein DCO77_03320 [Nitrospiraceae bacterium]|nr:hypothetical protein [Nitrospiraceae bacterium]
MKRIAFLLMTAFLAVSLVGCAGSRSFQRGERYAQRGQWDLAVKEYRRALKDNPGNIEYRSTLLRSQVTAANEHYKRARNFLRERKLDQAIVELQQAIFLSPSNGKIQSALKSVMDMKQAEEHYRASLTFMELSRIGEAIVEVGKAVELDPENVKYHDTLDKLRKQLEESEKEEALSLASDKPITLNFKSTNIKQVFELLSKLSGINILFDPDVRAQPVTVFVKDVSFEQALDLLLSTNKLFMKKVNEDTIIIIPRNKAKINQYQDLKVRTFYLTNAEAKKTVNLLRSMLGVKKAYVNEALNSITIRDTPEKIKLAGKVIAANDLKEPEVILDIEILEISRTKTLQYGWNFSPSTISAGIGNTGTDSITLESLRVLGKEEVVFSTIPGIVINLLKQDSDAQTLANPRVRVLNKQKAKFHIGDKIPVQTAKVAATTTTTVTSTFEYKDVGIKVNVEPVIHLNNTVRLKLGLEISTLGDALDFGEGQKQFKFGTRNTDTVLTLRDGETVIIGGLIQDQERRGRIKVPLLGDIPVIGKLFSSADDSTIKTDILMSITPNIVRPLELPKKDIQSFWSGTQETYDTKPLFVSTKRKSTKRSRKEKDKTKSAVLDTLAKREPQQAPTMSEEPRPLPAPAAVLAMNPTEAVTTVGDRVKFMISAMDVQDLYGTIIRLSYDKKTVEFISATEGSLLKKDGQQTSFVFSNNANAGIVELFLTRIGDVGGVGGAGELCGVEFRGKSKDKSSISISATLTNFNREQKKLKGKGAEVTVE